MDDEIYFLFEEDRYVFGGYEVLFVYVDGFEFGWIFGRVWDVGELLNENRSVDNFVVVGCWFYWWEVE